jgi:peptide deformylase
VIINASYEGIGYRAQMWEGCISSGSGDNTLYAKVPRYKKINANWIDENGIKHHEILDGFLAHVFQHEVDHLDGVLFVDKVKDTTSYMLASEYRKQFVKKN